MGEGREENERIMKTFYEGTVRPHLECGSTAWSTSDKINLQALDRQGPHQPRQTCKPWTGSSSAKINLQALDRVLISQNKPASPEQGPH